MSKSIFDRNVRIKVHNANHIITTFNSDNNKHEWFYYDDKELWIDSHQLNIAEFDEKYKNILIDLKYQMLDKPKVLLNVYNASEYYGESNMLLFHDELETVLINNSKWGYNRADIIVITKELIVCHQ